MSAVVSSERRLSVVADRRYNSFKTALEKDFEPAVVVSWQRGHNAFLADFAPIILVEEVPDTREDSGSPLPKFNLGREVPNIVGGNEAFEGIAIVTELIVNERAKKRDFKGLLVAIDRACLDLVIWSVCQCVAVIWSGCELGVQQRDVAIELEVAVRAG